MIKRTISESEDEEEADTGQGTIRQHRRQSSGPVDPSSGSSSSGGGAPSEDWSVISEQDERRSSFGSRDSKPNSKRNSGFAAMLSVLPDAFIPGSPRRRTISTNSQS